MQELSLEDFSDNKIDTSIDAVCINGDVEVSISYTSSFKSAKLLRDIVDQICKKVGINPKWRTRLVLIIDELNNNAIEYGSISWEKNLFFLSLKKDASGNYIVESRVSDTWNWPRAKSAEEMESIREKNNNKDFSSHTSIRWRGLFLIISQLVDTIYFKDNAAKWLTVGIKKTLSWNS